MSELAPFVAATLRDRVVLELDEALRRERQTNGDLQSLEVLIVKDRVADGGNNGAAAGGGRRAYHSKGHIPNGAYEERSFVVSNTDTELYWKVNLPNPAPLLQNNDSSSSTTNLFLPPTLEAIQNLRIRMGGGWWEKTLFGEYADPHVIPKRYDALTQTAHFEVAVFAAAGGGGGRVRALGLCVKPVVSAEQFHHIVGAPPGGLFSRLVRWVQQAAIRKEKERFLIFTKVLMKYLQQKDPALCRQVKQIIIHCYKKNRKKVPGYESVTSAMRIQMREVVSENYWERAEAYLVHFLKEKAKTGSQTAQRLTDKKKQQQVQVWVDSVFLDVGEMQSVFNTMHIPPTPQRRGRQAENNNLPPMFGAELQLQQGIRNAIQRAHVAQLQRQARAAQDLANANNRQARAQLQMLQPLGNMGNGDGDAAP